MKKFDRFLFKQNQLMKKIFFSFFLYPVANKGKGEMMLWFPEKVKDIDIVAAE